MADVSSAHPRTKCALKALGPHLLAPFPAKRLRSARVVWRNARWLIAAGVDVTSEQELKSFDQWVLGNFALVASSSPDFESDIMPGPAIQAFADRYGGTAGAIHGGSGRCAIIGDYIAKGIGRTPLVGRAEHWHASGNLPLSDAIHEAIGAEINYAEAPNRAIPVVAIIATGLKFFSQYGPACEERAISIRPTFARIAHVQRSIFFGSSGWVGSDQEIDARRTRDAIAAIWGKRDKRAELSICSSGVEETMGRLAHHLAFSRVHRLWTSTMSPSNFTVDGAPLDHGSFKAVPDWTRAWATEGLPSFGDDAGALTSLAKSLAFYRRKYLGICDDVPALVRATHDRLTCEFRNEIGVALGLRDSHADLADRICEIFQQLYKRQQKRTAYLGEIARRQWIYRHLASSCAATRIKDECSLPAAELRSEISKSLASEPEKTATIWSAMLRLTRSRPNLFYNHLRYRCERLARQLLASPSEGAELVRAFVGRNLTHGRRLWRDIPGELSILGQVVDTYCAALHCYDNEKREHCLWVEAAVHQQTVFFFQQRAPFEFIPGGALTGDRLMLRMPLTSGVHFTGARRVHGFPFAVPAMAYLYLPAPPA